MAMAVVSAQLNLLGLHPPSRTIDCEKCGRSNVVSAAVSRPRGNYVGRSGYLPLICQASSGGSRRDYQKIVARTQRRRASKWIHLTFAVLILSRNLYCSNCNPVLILHKSNGDDVV